MAKATKQRIVKFVSPTDGTVFHLDADTLEVEAYQAEGTGPVRPVEDAPDREAEQPADASVDGSGEAEPDEPAPAPGDGQDEEDVAPEDENPFSLW